MVAGAEEDDGERRRQAKGGRRPPADGIRGALRKEKREIRGREINHGDRHSWPKAAVEVELTGARGLGRRTSGCDREGGRLTAGGSGDDGGGDGGARQRGSGDTAARERRRGNGGAGTAARRHRNDSAAARERRRGGTRATARRHGNGGSVARERRRSGEGRGEEGVLHQASGGPKIQSDVQPNPSRKPSDIDPSRKDPTPTGTETGPSAETGPTAEDRLGNNQPATCNVEINNETPTGNQSAEAGVDADQEPPTGNQSGPMIGDEEEVLWIQSAEDSRPPILVKWWDDNMQPQGIVINKQKEDEEVCLLKKALGQATHLVNKLVPHLGTLEATRNQLYEAKELARKTEHDLRDRIAELQDSNFELSGSSKDRKIKSQAQFYVLVNKIKRLEGARDEIANAATPLVQAMFFNNNAENRSGYIKNIKEARSMGASLALAITKSLYPKIDIDAVDGFADGTSEEATLDLINDAQKAADKIAVDVVERFQDNDLRPTRSNNSNDEKTDTN
uniref:Retrotransposon protein, putative, Ty3-gypsy subclass n=1 Tax=Oryza sativa subsp. japonica TaxID=39947 RepID=Q10ID0_ORYSJ|nr:retrotransposon protein, putative, Ty3-gypsy subclass [Oryza sativa Japonica Group]